MNNSDDVSEVNIDFSKLEKPTKNIKVEDIKASNELYGDIYFETKDHDIITGDKMRDIIHLIWGTDTPKSNNVVREFASRCEWILREVNEPSIETLVKNGHTTTAIMLYYKSRNDISLVEARDYVHDLEKKLRN